MNFDIIANALNFAIDNGYIETEEEALCLSTMLEAIKEGRVQIAAKVP